MSAPKKRIIFCTVGQSNEVGWGYTFDGLTIVSNVCKKGEGADPIGPNGTARGSMLPHFMDLMADENIKAICKNTAIAGSGLLQHWVGESVGDGTGTPFASGDGGYDPNSYISIVKTQLDIGSFDEKWAFISFGQADATDNVTAANFQLALENITNDFLDSGIKVAIGFSVAFTGELTWYEDNGLVGVTAALATFASNSNVVAGGNLYTAFGKSLTHSFLQTDLTHLVSPRGVEVAAEVWFDALNGTTFTQ